MPRPQLYITRLNRASYTFYLIHSIDFFHWKKLFFINTKQWPYIDLTKNTFLESNQKCILSVFLNILQKFETLFNIFFRTHDFYFSPKPYTHIPSNLKSILENDHNITKNKYLIRYYWYDFMPIIPRMFFIGRKNEY